MKFEIPAIVSLISCAEPTLPRVFDDASRVIIFFRYYGSVNTKGPNAPEDDVPPPDLDVTVNTDRPTKSTVFTHDECAVKVA